MKYKFIKPDSFIGRYMQSMEVVETPHSYDFWCACWLMSQALGRRTIVARPSAPVYMNWYMILVAESGITRKSTAVRFATQLARECFELWKDVHLTTVKVTPEELERVLHKQTADHGHAQYAIAISELVTFLGREKAMMQMPGLLTDLFDCPALRAGGGTLTRGETLIRNNFTTLLAASTPVWLVRSINPDVIEGGFTSRTLFVADEARKRKIAWSENERETYDFVMELTAIREMSERTPEIKITEPALARFRKWYNSRVESRDVFRASFESREDAHILRLAAMLAVNDNSWQISAENIINAIAVINDVKEKGAMIFEASMDQSDLSVAIDKLRSALMDAGKSGLKQSVLAKLVVNYLKGTELRAILMIMHELGMVNRFDKIKLAGKGAPATVWQATQLILQPDAIDVIKGAML